MRPKCIGWWLLAMLLVFPCAVRVASAQSVTSATFGDVVTLASGTPSDIVLDESRHYLYLINNTTSQVYILDYTTNLVVGSITVGSTPLAGAMSMDNRWLYVTSSGTATLNVIDLSSMKVTKTVVLTSAPQGVEVGSDGRVLISQQGTVVSNVPTGTLALYDPTQTGTAALQTVAVPSLPSTPAAIPTTTLPRPITTFASKLLRTPDGNYIVGVITPTNSNTYIFVYEVASGIVLRNRTMSGLSSILSMSPDGSKFMSGLNLIDISTLQVIAQENFANAPFAFTATLSGTTGYNTQQNVGGSIFAPDGSALYAAFNIAPVTTPATATQASTLVVNDPTNLGIRLGIKLPESIVAKVVMTKDGSQAWAPSDSGVTHLPLGSLYTYPILSPETNTVFLAMDDCNRGVASAALKINNLGSGKLTYSVATTNAALVYQQSSGLAPSTITFTMEPGRTGITRQAGTNIWSGGTGVTSVSGTPLTVTLSSPEAINVPTSIRVYMNYRQPDQRGIIYPIPTTPNLNYGGANSSLVATAAGNEGLQDLLLDEPRGLLYITNSGFNRIEVFDTKAQAFLNPISVGQMPHQMAMGSDGNTLYVGNTGGESISIVDLNLQQVVNTVVFPAIPRNGTSNPIYPRTIAMGLTGLLFVSSAGNTWDVVNNIAVPRANSTTTVEPVTLGGTAPSYGMIATPGADYILTVSADGHSYIYDATNDVYVTSRYLNTSTSTAITGYYGPIAAGPAGSYYLVDGDILSSSLTQLGGSFVTSTTGRIVPARNVFATAPLTSTSFLRLTTPIRTSITSTTSDDSRTTLELVDLANGSDNLIGVIPEQPFFTVLSTQRYNSTARNMVVDSAGTTAYALTISGLSVISLASATTATQPVITSVVNAYDGTSNVQPGSFITINGQNLATTAKASTVPAPTVLGGSCVTFGDVLAPLLVTSTGQIQAQVPSTLLSGTQVVEVRSLARAQDSAPFLLTLKSATSTSTSTKVSGTTPTPEKAGLPGKK